MQFSINIEFIKVCQLLLRNPNRKPGSIATSPDRYASYLGR